MFVAGAVRDQPKRGSSNCRPVALPCDRTVVPAQDRAIEVPHGVRTVFPLAKWVTA